VSCENHLCESCHAGCCRAYAVPITGADVIRLARATGLTFWDFACRWEDRDGIISGDYAPQLYFADEPLTPFALCLLHEPSRHAPATTKWRFLQETPASPEQPLGGGRCGVYADRPSACRVFPLKLAVDSPLTILADVPPHGRPDDGHELYRLCPRPWQPSDVDPLTAPADLAVARSEMAFFKQVAVLWNERLGSWLKFPEFLRLVYANRVVRQTKPVEQGGSADPVTLPFPTETRSQRRVA
jgi:Fe-S-cluster containining protein